MISSNRVSDGAQKMVADTPTATIVVCTRDRAPLLVDALQHLRAAAGDAEILVVDSGSTTAATRDAAEAAGVRYVRSDIPGLSIARNVGLTHARGATVVYTDDDCAVDPEFLAPLLAPFADPSVGASTGRLIDMNHGSRETTDQVRVLERPWSGLDAGHGALMAFRTSTLRRLGGFDPVLGAGRTFGGAEDMDAFARVLHAGFRVVRVPGSVVTHVYTRDDEAYERLNENYGLGIGAMSGKWARSAGVTGLRIAALVVRRALVRWARRAGQARTHRGQTAYLGGLVRGLAAARTLPVKNLLFVDVDPPAPVPLPAGTGATLPASKRRTTTPRVSR